MTWAYYNDLDPFCCDVLKARIADGSLPKGTVDRRDIREVDPEELREFAQIHLFAGIGGFPLGLRMAGWPDERPILTGGFPCQDLSLAGRGAGIAGERSGLWGSMARAIGVVRPENVLVENVAALLGRGLGVVLGDLAALGYDAEWHCIPASAVGAPHRRDRIWIAAYPRGEQHEGGCASHQWARAARLPEAAVADADDQRQPQPEGCQQEGQRWAGNGSQPRPDAPTLFGPSLVWGEPDGNLAGRGDVADAGCAGRADVQGRGSAEGLDGDGAAGGSRIGAGTGDHWRSEPSVGRVVDGVPNRVAQLRALGNAVVPQVVARIAQAMMRAAA